MAESEPCRVTAAAKEHDGSRLDHCADDAPLNVFKSGELATLVCGQRRVYSNDRREPAFRRDQRNGLDRIAPAMKRVGLQRVYRLPERWF